MAPRRRPWLISLLLHALALATVAWLGRGAVTPANEVAAPSDLRMVWIASPGPGGGGGGGSNQTPLPVSPPIAPGRDPQTAAPPPPAPAAKPSPIVEPPPLGLIAASRALGAGLAPGLADAPPSAVSSAVGSGTGAGAGEGRGAGSGEGTGSGAGAGMGGGAGGGVYRAGNGVIPPIQLAAGQPKYTLAAMRAQIEGVVVVECVVNVDGRCVDPRVVRSLDPALGLDEQAKVAARQWRFRPGTRLGAPVPVWVLLEIGFTLH